MPNQRMAPDLDVVFPGPLHQRIGRREVVRILGGMRRLGLHAVLRSDDIVVGLDVRQLGLRVTPGDIARGANEEFPGIRVLKPHGGRWNCRRLVGVAAALSVNRCGRDRARDQGCYNMAFHSFLIQTDIPPEAFRPSRAGCGLFDSGPAATF